MQSGSRRTSDHPRWLCPIVRTTVLLLAVMALLAHGAAGQAARADGSSADITNTKLQMAWSYPDKDTGKTTTTNTGGIASLPLSQADEAILQPLSLLAIVPLGDAFDQLWSQTPDKNNETMLDQSCTLAQNDLTSEVQSGSFDAHGVSCSFTSTGGSVSAVIETSWSGPENQRTLQPTTITGQRVLLSYLVPNNSVTFSVTSPVTGGNSPFSDAQFTATFDLDLTIYLVTSDSTCTLKPTAIGSLSNLNINPDNTEANIAMDIPDVQSLIGSVTSVVNGETFPVGSGSNTGQLGPLSQVWGVACALGFSQVNASVDPNKGLTLQFTHPLEGAPTTFGQVGSLFGATIEPSQSQQVNAGGQLAVSGNYFTYYNPNQTSSATSLNFQWGDPSSSDQITESDINWGPQGGKLQTVTKSRKPNDKQNFFQTPNNLTPNTAYQFQVRDCDPVTCSAWSEPQIYSTGIQGSNNVQFSLDNDSSTQIGQATVGQDGTFSTNVTIPKGTTPGQHTLNATVAAANGQQASTTIAVLGTNQSAQPEIALVDSNTGSLMQPGGRVVAGSPFTLNGDGFGDSQSVTVYLDSDGGQVVGTTQTDNNGSFQTQLTMPVPQSGGYGYHNLVAVATVGDATSNGRTLRPELINPINPIIGPITNGQTDQATVSVYVDAAAQ